jgi:hypothetical protein
VCLAPLTHADHHPVPEYQLSTGNARALHPRRPDHGRSYGRRGGVASVSRSRAPRGRLGHEDVAPAESESAVDEVGQVHGAQLAGAQAVEGSQGGQGGQGGAGGVGREQCFADLLCVRGASRLPAGLQRSARRPLVLAHRSAGPSDHDAGRNGEWHAPLVANVANADQTRTLG